MIAWIYNYIWLEVIFLEGVSVFLTIQLYAYNLQEGEQLSTRVNSDRTRVLKWDRGGLG